MPGPALHYLFAGVVYRRWESTPVTAPFELGTESYNAFLHGALGPDMGYFPGADPLLADLAHHARTGAFCRALVAEAETEVERAFAWGWVTHVLADIAVHPLVNEACGEQILGVRLPLWGSTVATVHVQVETGLDAAYHRRYPELARFRGLSALGPDGFGAVHRAYGRTFGAAPGLDALLAAHSRVTLLLRPYASIRSVAAKAVGAAGTGRLARITLRVAALLSLRNPNAWGMFTPVPPSPWLVAEVDDIVAGFGDWFEGHYVSELRFLRDHCLDTGEPDCGEQPCGREAIDALLARIVRVPELSAAA